MSVGSDFFWRLFQASGHVGAYLLYSDLRKLQQADSGGEDASVEEAAVELASGEAALASDEESRRA